MKKMLILFALGIMIFGCIGPEPEPEQPTAQYGDNVSVNYILTVNGKVVDTNINQVARDEEIYSPFRNYQPLTFTLLLGDAATPYIPGFVKGIVGMKVNESKIVTIPPSDDTYGLYDPTRVYNVSKFYIMDALETVPMSYFEGMNITVEEGTLFNTEMGRVIIDNITGDNVTLFYFFDVGHSFYYNGFHHIVSGASENLTYVIMFDVRENGTYTTTSLIDGKPVEVRVTKLTNTTITFDENHPLAGETLVFNLTLLDLVKAG